MDAEGGWWAWKRPASCPRHTPTFATRPFALLTLANPVFLHLVAVRAAGADARAVVCHHVVICGDNEREVVTEAPGAPRPGLVSSCRRADGKGPRSPVSFILRTKNERLQTEKESSLRGQTTTWRNKDISSQAENRCVKEKTPRLFLDLKHICAARVFPVGFTFRTYG